MATAIHLSKWAIFLASPGEFALLLSAFFVLLRPGSVARFGLMVSIEVAVGLGQLPWLRNHGLLLLVMSLTLLASIFVARRRATGLEIDGERVFAIAAPVLRAEVILLYLFASFHKLNTAWFDPTVSCGYSLLSGFQFYMPWLEIPDWMRNASIGIGIGIEVLLAVLLTVKRWRPAGILLGGLFHLTLGALGFFRFSSLLYACYFVFVSDDFLERARVSWLQLRERYTGTLLLTIERLSRFASRERLTRLALVAMILLAVVVITRSPWREFTPMLRLAHGSGGLANWVPFNFAAQAAWLAWSLALYAIYLGSIGFGQSTRAGLQEHELVPGPPRWLWILPLLICINGASPYLGLKTESSFSMFSNLRTAGAHGTGSNHLLIKSPLRLVSYWGDLVQINDSSDPVLARIANDDYHVPRIELASYVQARVSHGDDFSLDYQIPRQREATRRYSVDSVQNDENPFPAAPWLIRKLVYFRPVYAGGPASCTH